jgi:hypothetical protein
MLERYSKRVKSLFKATSVWCITMFCTFIFFWDGDGKFSIFWGIWYGPLALAGLILGLFNLLLIFKEKSIYLPLAMLLLLVGETALLVNGKGMEWGIWPRFYLAKAYYDSKVKKVFTATNTNEAEKVCDGRCMLNKDEKGNITQVLFPMGKVGGFFGWSAFVYDPNGDVMESAKAWRGDKFVKVRPRSNRYFGCYLYRAQHLTGNWYFCGFGHS